MDQIIKWIIVFLIGLLFVKYYLGIVQDYRREKKIYYIRKKSFLLMGNDGNLLSLTVEKHGFDAQIHYAADLPMSISESEG